MVRLRILLSFRGGCAVIARSDEGHHFLLLGLGTGVVVDRWNPSLQQLVPSRLFRYVETGALLGCIGLHVGLTREVVIGLTAAAPAWWLSVAAVIGAYLLADLLAGVVHFVGDSFGTVDTPLLGLTFVLPFRSHHVHPTEICHHDFVATNGNNAFATLFLLAPALCFLPVRDGGGWALCGIFVWVLTLALMLTNQIHKWAHVRNPPALVKSLQRVGVLLSPDRHAAHHRPPYVGGYCVTSGLCNRLLDPIGFFPLLERGIRAALCLRAGKQSRNKP